MENKKDLKKVKDELPQLTEQNWRFLEFLQAGKKVREAYELAGYQGKNYDTPYVFYNKLKKKLIQIQDADSLDGLRLRNKLTKILDMPLAYDKVSVKDHLKAIELAHKLTGQEKEEKPTISAFVIHKYEEKPREDVIDVKEIDE